MTPPYGLTAAPQGAPPADRQSRIRGGRWASHRAVPPSARRNIRSWWREGVLRVVLRIAVGTALTFGVGLASSQSVTFNGRMGERALLIVDGQARTVSVGSSVGGVKLLGLTEDAARVEVNGQALTLPHGAPVSIGRAANSAGSGREIVLAAGPGGHFLTRGSINGKPVRFMVDTGATTVAMSAMDADRIGLDYKSGDRGWVQTANGVTPAYRTLLNSVRIGDVEVHQVIATVTQQPMEFVLLGNTFLSRFQLQTDNNTLRLQKK